MDHLPDGGDKDNRRGLAGQLADAWLYKECPLTVIQHDLKLAMEHSPG
jgi:hypothetical protein